MKPQDYIDSSFTAAIAEAKRLRAENAELVEALEKANEIIASAFNQGLIFGHNEERRVISKTIAKAEGKAQQIAPHRGDNNRR